MWILLPALSLALVHIAGDNIAVVPDMAILIGHDIYITTFIAYFVFGTIITGLSAWIGVATGQELTVVVKRLFGCVGKKVLALVILAVCIPASALTGGYFAGWALEHLTGLTPVWATIACLVLFALLAAGYGEEFLKASNYVGLLLLPVMLFVICQLGFTFSFGVFNSGSINWPLVFALIGYNAGGMRPSLVVEAAAYLTKKGYRVVGLAILAKMVEGLFTLLMAHIALSAGSKGPLVLAQVVGEVVGPVGYKLFYLILFCIFMNTMAPAMKVNARQMAILTDMSFWPALVLGTVIVWIYSFMGLRNILLSMSITGLFMATFIIYTAFFLHKKNQKQ